MRASAVVEKCGIPSASLICDGFIGQAKAIAAGLGVDPIPIARIVGHVDAQTAQELRDNIEGTTINEVIRCLSEPQTLRNREKRLENKQVVAIGSFDKINKYFYEKKWSDGLPVIPPTVDRVKAFLEYTSENPDRTIGILQPSGSTATPTNVAINGVMANCKPEYMPVLIAIAEVLTNPSYGVEHSGDTTGGDALIVLSGPILSELGFNSEGAALRDGYQANTSVGRFLRLFLRNVAGLLPEGTDKSTFGHTWRVALAENEKKAREFDWPLFREDRGYKVDDNIVTIGRYTSGGGIGSIYGNEPIEIAKNLADGLVRHSSWELIFTVGFARGTYRPLLILSPLIVQTLKSNNVSKAELRELLFLYARLPAQKMETYIGLWSNLVPGRPTLEELVQLGTAAPHFALSTNPQRMVPIVERPEDIFIVVSGDPMRSNAYVFASNGMHGFPTSQLIRFKDHQA